MSLKYLFLFLCFWSSNVSGGLFDHRPLAERATDPLSKLRQIQLESDFTPSNFGSADCSNIFYVKPILPIAENRYFPLPQLIRIEFQIVSLAKTKSIKPGTVLGDTQIFDLFIIEMDWGRWGLGPMFILPTARGINAGQGKWQAGPALAASVLKFPKWQFGFLLQNPIAFAGCSHRSFVNTLYFQPFFTYHLEHNWYITANPQWQFQWNKRNVQIPVNLGIGKVFSIGGLHIDASLDGEWMVYKNAAGVVPHFTLQFSFNILLDDKSIK